MKSTRRSFLAASALGAAGAPLLLNSCSDNDSAGKQRGSGPDYSLLDEAASMPVLKRDLFPDPVIIDSLELLRYEDNFICRVTSTDGAEGLSVANNEQMASLYPVFVNRLQPLFPGKDARDWEALLEEAYIYRSNYKLQNLALWVPLATIEFAVLDMLGKLAGLPMGKLIGEIHHPRVAVYQANNFRGKTAAESIGLIRRQVARSGARAVKIKVGGRMSHNRDYPPGRTEALIPMVRSSFGDDMILYADSNGSYDVSEAIRIGQLLEEYGYDFYEEPVPFDWYEETRQVNEALDIPLAGGEQEPSMRNFRWLIGNDALDIVQPDIFYFGGMIRSMRVARMAAAMDKACTPHLSGSGLGYLYMMHFVSALPNAGPFHEFKGFSPDIPLDGPGSSMSSFNGMVVVPTGPGLGMTIDPGFVAKHKVVEI
jgi:L-alanine-DL-glutamate epimerase-like enolase superfamily enzyme